MAYQIELKSQPRRDLAVVKFHSSVAEVGQHIGAAFGAVQGYLAKAGIQSQGPAIGYYEPREQDFDVSAGFVVPAAIPGDGSVVPAELPACEAAVTTHVGGYDSLPAAYSAIRAWMELSGRRPAKGMWEEYLSDPSTPPGKMRTVIVWPVAAASD